MKSQTLQKMMSAVSKIGMANDKCSPHGPGGKVMGDVILSNELGQSDSVSKDDDGEDECG